MLMVAWSSFSPIVNFGARATSKALSSLGAGINFGHFFDSEEQAVVKRIVNRSWERYFIY
jgi:hypothetical protein